MSDQITYDNKVDLQVATNIANINKVTASDMNEIKNVVNGNAEEVGDITSLTTTDKTSVVNAINELETDKTSIVNAINELETDKLETSAIVNEPSTETDEVYSSDYLNDKLVSVGTTAPTDGRRVWFANSKNVLQHSAYDRTLNGITLKVNDDKSITLTGTASANTNFNIGTNATITLKAGTYTFTKGATNVQLLIYYSSASVLGNLPIGTSSQTITINKDTTYENYRVVIAIPNGTQINEIVYPMLRLSTTSNTYEPYIEKSINVDDEEWYSKPKVLWESSAGVTSGSITLNESIVNYSYIEVEYSINTYSSFRGVARLTKSSSTSTAGSLVAEFGNGTANGIICWTARIVINNANATIERNYCLNFTSSGNTAFSDNYISVLKILGYKE